MRRDSPAKDCYSVRRISEEDFQLSASTFLCLNIFEQLIRIGTDRLQHKFLSAPDRELR
jgi:hypothetical protein